MNLFCLCLIHRVVVSSTGIRFILILTCRLTKYIIRLNASYTKNIHCSVQQNRAPSHDHPPTHCPLSTPNPYTSTHFGMDPNNPHLYNLENQQEYRSSYPDDSYIPQGFPIPSDMTWGNPPLPVGDRQPDNITFAYHEDQDWLLHGYSMPENEPGGWDPLDYANYPDLVLTRSSTADGDSDSAGPITSTYSFQLVPLSPAEINALAHARQLASSRVYETDYGGQYYEPGLQEREQHQPLMVFPVPLQPTVVPSQPHYSAEQSSCVETFAVRPTSKMSLGEQERQTRLPLPPATESTKENGPKAIQRQSAPTPAIKSQSIAENPTLSRDGHAKAQHSAPASRQPAIASASGDAVVIQSGTGSRAKRRRTKAPHQAVSKEKSSSLPSSSLAVPGPSTVPSTPFTFRYDQSPIPDSSFSVAGPSNSRALDQPSSIVQAKKRKFEEEEPSSQESRTIASGNLLVLTPEMQSHIATVQKVNRTKEAVTCLWPCNQPAESQHHKRAIKPTIVEMPRRRTACWSLPFILFALSLYYHLQALERQSNPVKIWTEPPYKTPIPEKYYHTANTTRRANAVIVMLARNSDIDGAESSIVQFETTFNRKFGYPYVFLNDVPFTEEFKRRMQGVVSSSAQFGLIPESHWQQPSWINEEKASRARDKMGARHVPFGTSVSYRNMCRFYSGFFFRHPLLLPYRYYWRLEPDVEFFCDVEFDPFLFMKGENKKYGFTISLPDDRTTIRTLRRNVREFVDKNPDLISPDNAVPMLLDTRKNGMKEYNRCHFWSNFEIGDFDLWRSEPYMKFFEFLDSRGGFYYERWGDAPVHTFGAALFARKDQIHFFNEIGYQHGAIAHCPEGPAFTRGKCRCSQAASIDRKPLSCLSRYDALFEGDVLV
ncbi:Glycosyltransferase family 15 protein [Mycena indigotica]|uniref:Glycosyltransferase family 15 protein n=1 Tax=Mycena indigotica TaxID=2126181 RepID=A0A8H6SSL1_9AGAR|nr:Glycosyltransferase family 15 protein [Mycena indigotica]KAF7303926.1 Glycosyltransferase family 15 protein [Mycena indigotica]